MRARYGLLLNIINHNEISLKLPPAMRCVRCIICILLLVVLVVLNWPGRCYIITVVTVGTTGRAVIVSNILGIVNYCTTAGIGSLGIYEKNRRVKISHVNKKPYFMKGYSSLVR